MRKTVIFAAVLAVAAVAAYVASPYWTLHQIRSAAAAGQGDRVAAYVDFPAMRESLKAQFVQAMATRMESKGKDGQFAALGQAFAMQMVNGLVDAMITPEAVAAMIGSGKAPRPNLEAKPQPNPANVNARREPKIRHSFESLSTFHATLVDPDTNEDLLTAVLTREGAFTWKLTAVRMPALVKP